MGRGGWPAQELIPSLAKSIPWNRFLAFLNGGRSTNTSSERECLPPPPHTQTFHTSPRSPFSGFLGHGGTRVTRQIHYCNFNYRKRFWSGGPHREEANEADFLGFLQKLVPHESLTLPFGPPTLHIVDTGSRRLPVSLSRGVDDSAYR